MTPSRIDTHDIIVVGGSAGGLEALLRLLGPMPANFAATMFVTLHIPNDMPSYLPRILTRAGPLPTRNPSENETFEKGVIYIAPPDRHLLINDSHVHLSHGPRENRHRPAIDPMFRSAARYFGRRVIGIILSGQLDDGSVGLMAVKMRGGVTIVQEPHEATASQMPRQAIRYAAPDHVLPIADIASLLERLHRQPVQPRPASGSLSESTNDMHFESELNDRKRSKPSAFACPECHGVLWEVEDAQLLRFRCRVGHAYTAEALNQELSETAEAALWAALRAVEEKAALLQRLANGNQSSTAASYRDQASGYAKHAETLRNMIRESVNPRGGSAPE
ncbi:MAG: chemotaxis protein CheB [Sulfurifustaceae bacterium]